MSQYHICVIPFFVCRTLADKLGEMSLLPSIIHVVEGRGKKRLTDDYNSTIKSLRNYFVSRNTDIKKESELIYCWWLSVGKKAYEAFF